MQSVDFFTPIVDDPFVFGQIAAANALSDLYAMGARPLTALNIVAFPVAKMDINVFREIVLGGLDKVHEAGAVLLGGHSIDDPEIKYGLAVTGLAHPDRILLNSSAQVGDKIVLTAGGNVILEETTFPAICVWALAPMLPLINVVYDRITDRTDDPSPKGWDHFHCADTGVEDGGIGRLLFRVYCEKVR